MRVMHCAPSFCVWRAGNHYSSTFVDATSKPRTRAAAFCIIRHSKAVGNRPRMLLLLPYVSSNNHVLGLANLCVGMMSTSHGTMSVQREQSAAVIDHWMSVSRSSTVAKAQWSWASSPTCPRLGSAINSGGAVVRCQRMILKPRPWLVISLTCRIEGGSMKAELHAHIRSIERRGGASHMARLASGRRVGVLE